MTLILGISDPDNGRAILCADSGVWSGRLVATNTQPKLFRRGGYIAALCGSVWKARAAETVTFEEGEAPSPQAYADLMLDAIAERQRRVSVVDDEKIGEWGVGFARGTLVYDCGPDGGVACPGHGVIAVGSGDDFAHGAAVALLRQHRLSRIGLAEEVMRAARDHIDGCHGVLHWMATDGTEGAWA